MQSPPCSLQEKALQGAGLPKGMSNWAGLGELPALCYPSPGKRHCKKVPVGISIAWIPPQGEAWGRTPGLGEGEGNLVYSQPHAQVWKGVRSGSERVFLRMGRDFSISSFKISFPRLEVT